MKDVKTFGDLMKLALAAAGVTAYISLSVGETNGSYYYGLIIAAMFLFVAYFFSKKKNAAVALEEVIEGWGKALSKKRNITEARKYFDIVYKESDLVKLDDQSWNDLNMDELYTILDRNLTTAGEHVLYDILRTPLLQEEPLIHRNNIIKFFQSNNEIREKIQSQLWFVGRLKEGDILSLLWGTLKKKNMRIVSNIAALMPIVAILLIPVFSTNVIFIFALSFAVNMYIHYKHGAKHDSGIKSIGYLAELIKAADIISKIENHELSTYFQELKLIYNKCKPISKGSSNIGVPGGIDAIWDYVNIALLIEERSYYRVINHIEKYREELRRLHRIIGEIDSLAAIASYREEIKDYVEPKFARGNKGIKIEELIHPLLKAPVSNNININKSGIIITGSNMSGKSTFLRALGVSVLFAQTIYTVTAGSYEGDLYNIMTSISPSDNIMGGKSYYLGEAEAILRIIQNCSGDIPVLCIVDEIFRGTNPLERISASVAILNYILQHNATVVVATHDLELTEILKDTYEPYYFMEDVDYKEGLQFDYKIRQGVSHTRNAIKLLNFLGYPKDIVKEAEERIIKA